MSAKWKEKPLLLCGAAALFLTQVACSSLPGGRPRLSSTALWSEYLTNPNGHSRIPNNSYAGYKYGELALPQVEKREEESVRYWGARGDGLGDDTMAIQLAIDAARERGGGKVYLPEGIYRLEGRLSVSGSNIILYGDGPEKTILFFQKSLHELSGAGHFLGRSLYAWNRGLIEIAPEKMGLLGKKQERWAAQELISQVARPARRGEQFLLLEQANGIKAGDWVLITWNAKMGHDFLNQMAGFSVENNFFKEAAGPNSKQIEFSWPVEIANVSANQIELKQPLRLDIKVPAAVSIGKMLKFSENIGIENLSVKMNSFVAERHLKERGFNGIFFHQAINSWIKNVNIENADNGIMLESVKSITVDGVQLNGSKKMHHGFFTKNTHDSLFSNFTVNAPVRHGISADRIGSGNVWRRGIMHHGTFDLHNGMQFDLIRTDIKIKNDGRLGGDEGILPQQGARVVHWNIEAEGTPDNVNQPELMPSGALVGVRGARRSADFESKQMALQQELPCILSDEGEMPPIKDLYEAQLRLRLHR